MTTVITATSSAEFLTLLPHLAGYTPRQSIVLIPFEQSRTVGLLRLDLPVADIDEFAATAVGLLCRLPHADGLALVVYTDGAVQSDDAVVQSDDAVVHADIAAAIAIRATACGLHLRDSLCVGRDGWRSYITPGGGVRPLSEIAPQRSTLPAPIGDQHDGADASPVSAERSARVRAELIRMERSGATVQSDDRRHPMLPPAAIEMLRGQQFLDDPTLLWTSALTTSPDSLSDTTAALLLWMLARPALRDAALAFWCFGPEGAKRVERAQRRRETAGVLPRGFQEPAAPEPAFLAGQGPRPNGLRLEVALRTVRELAALADDAVVGAGALGCAAWLSWTLGRGTHALRYAKAALRSQPEHGLAMIVERLVLSGRLPDWAFEPEAAAEAAAT